TEKLLALAINDVKEHGLSYEAAARQRGVPPKTVWNRANGRKERHAAHELEQALKNDEEAEIVAWCRRMERRYLPVRLIHVVGCAEAIWNNKNGTLDEHLGRHWVTGFMEQHPKLKLTTSKR
ncbi:hypothetical protein BDV93DRAFT_398624, partial [Ceratobasidium sp. AG-I]